MLEDSQPGGPMTGAGVVNVQRAFVIEGKVGLGYHVPSLTTGARAVRMTTVTTLPRWTPEVDLHPRRPRAATASTTPCALREPDRNGQETVPLRAP